MSKKYGMRSSATYTLKHYLQDLECISKKSTRWKDTDKLLDLVVDGVLKFEDYCRKMDIDNISSTPIIMLSHKDVLWITTEFGLGDQSSLVSASATKGYAITSVKRVNARHIIDWLVIITNPDLVIQNACSDLCAMLNDHELTMDYYYKLRATEKAKSVNGSFSVFMKMLSKNNWMDLLDVLFGSNNRPKRLKKWLLKSDYAELVRNS